MHEKGNTCLWLVHLWSSISEHAYCLISGLICKHFLISFVSVLSMEAPSFKNTTDDDSLKKNKEKQTRVVNVLHFYFASLPRTTAPLRHLVLCTSSNGIFSPYIQIYLHLFTGTKMIRIKKSEPTKLCSE